MSIFRMAERLSGRWPDSQGFCGVRDFDEPQVWLYTRFNLSLRDVEELLAERGVQVSYETIRRWVMKFGPEVARRLSCDRPRPHPLWHLDEMYVSIGGRWMYLWRAIDQNGEVLDVLVQAKRDNTNVQKESSMRPGP